MKGYDREDIRKDMGGYKKKNNKRLYKAFYITGYIYPSIQSLLYSAIYRM